MWLERILAPFHLKGNDTVRCYPVSERNDKLLTKTYVIQYIFFVISQLCTMSRGVYNLQHL
jgi:hypothetical protein